MSEVIITIENVNSKDAYQLMEELSNQLLNITGNSGKSSFDLADMNNARSIFVIARKGKEVIGCGAFRELSVEVAEIKRMYSRIKSQGIGSNILRFLEVQAKEFGFQKVVLETRKCNEKAIAFYQKNDYIVISNYGKYKNNIEAICFEKLLN